MVFEILDKKTIALGKLSSILQAFASLEQIPASAFQKDRITAVLYDQLEEVLRTLES